MTDHALRQQVIAVAQKFNTHNLSVGMSGNVSARLDDACLITPSAVRYDALQTSDLVTLDFNGKVLQGDRPPSSEWHFHCGIYQSRPDVNAVLHMHSTYCTVLACAHKHIPAFHYMVAVAGGNDIPLVPYAIYGSSELSNHVKDGLKERNACLLANHGLVVVGADLDSAFNLAVEVENLARQYCQLLQTGTPQILSDAQMNEVLEKFKSYGKRT